MAESQAHVDRGAGAGEDRRLGARGWANIKGRRQCQGRPNFYEQKSKWEKEHGQEISTSDFSPLYVQSANSRIVNTTSQFDPVLAEIMLSWYSAKGWQVYDPFGGGVERGLVSAYLERPYTGVEIREEQVEANRSIAGLLALPAKAEWLEGDARETQALTAGRPQADFIFTCPPYWNLEVYSDSPSDLSNMDLPGFGLAMDLVIEGSLAALKPDRFAVMVMGDRRYGPRKQLAHLPAMMVESFERHGALLHNDIVMMTSLGSKPQIARHAFERRRTLTPIYEHVLVFAKGDAGAATKAMGDVELTGGSRFIGGNGQLALEAVDA